MDRIRHLARVCLRRSAPLLALVLAVKLLVPQGFMLELDAERGVRPVLCSGSAGGADLRNLAGVPFSAGEPSVAYPGHDHDRPGNSSHPCPFAVAASPLLAAGPASPPAPADATSCGRWSELRTLPFGLPAAAPAAARAPPAFA